MSKKTILPSLWSSDQLKIDHSLAVEQFISGRLNSGDSFYSERYGESFKLASEFMDLTQGLTDLSWERLVDRPDLLEDVGRFFAGPPISADDFRTIRGFRTIQRGNVQHVKESIYLISRKLDVNRFVWVREERNPLDSERRAALVATACLRAVEQTRTELRASQKVRQEGGVAEYLRRLPLVEVEKVDDADSDMEPGSFKAGVAFEGKQCDILVRLYDGRFLAIECKSTNSAVNSIKRLNDISDKEKVWKRARGAKVITAGVLAGVFDVNSLEKAQDNDVFLFWEHSLDALGSFIQSTK